MNQKKDQLSADTIRALAIAMIEKENSGHLGVVMVSVDYKHTFYMVNS